jgi:2-methylisocitrate lyase-like PEP mutase family enzyme
MSVTPSDKAARFRALHQAPGAFIIANAWDAGSARIFAGLGFQAIATSSGAQAGTLGKRDGKVSRDEALAHCRGIVEAVDLPVSADLERGFGDTPEIVAETILRAGEIGLAGASIEDAGADRSKPVLDFALSVDRVKAAVQAARALGFPFVLTGRAEGLLRGQKDVDEIIKRLQAYESAGADVLMAPGLPDLASVKKVCGAVTKPFNFMVGIPGKSFTVAELQAAGVKRISLATSLYKAAITGAIDAAREAKDKGTFGYLDRSISMQDFNAFMRD